MTANTPYLDSQKLVRCDVVNRYHESSIRFVEIDAFKLWEYLMSNKHGLRVTNPTLCLWVSQDEYEENEAIFERAGEVQSVDRIVIDLFDDEYGFSQTMTRYSRSNETENMVKILRSHIPSPLSESDCCSIDIVKGRVVQQWPHHADRKMLLGLHP